MQILAAVIIAMLIVFVSAPTTSAQNPIQLIVPFSPGGTVDGLARILARNLSTKKRPVIVRNRTGAGGQTALSFLASAKPDGSTLAVVPSTLAHAILNKKLVPVAILGRADLALFVSKSSKIKKLADFQEGRRTSVIVAAPTTPAKIAALRTFRQLNVPFRVTDVSSTEKRLQLLHSGSIDAIIVSASVAARFPDAINAIAVFSPQPYGSIDTAAQQGVPVDVAINYGIVGPPRLSASIHQRTSNDLRKLVPQPDFRKALESLGVTPEYQDSKEYHELLQQASNPHCNDCDCSETDCKDACPRCSS